MVVCRRVAAEQDCMLTRVQKVQGLTFRFDQHSVKVVGPGHASRPATFESDAFFSRLVARRVGRALLASSELPSTQTLLHQNISRLPDGTLCVTDTQTSGKGRGTNTWTSPPGCLMFSVYKQLGIAGDKLPFVQYVVSLALVRAAKEAAASLGADEDLNIRIKWPNDIYAKGLKIGGILCQSVYREGVFHLVVGVGLNTLNEEPTTCLAALIREHAGGTADLAHLRETLLASIANHLEDLLDVLTRTGFEPLKAEYERSWLHTNQKVTLEEMQAGQPGKISVTITGISKNAYMTAVDDSGVPYELHPDGNSLDFFKGLVRQKTAGA